MTRDEIALGLVPPRRCSRIIGEPAGVHTRYCGKLTAPGKDYCPACHAELHRGKGPTIRAPGEERIIVSTKRNRDHYPGPIPVDVATFNTARGLGYLMRS